MSCQLRTRGDVSVVVIKAISTKLKRNDVAEKTTIDKGLGLDPIKARRCLYDPVADAIIEAGCSAEFFLRAHVQRAKRVKDIVDKAWKSVEKGLKRAEDELAVETSMQALATAKKSLEECERQFIEASVRLRSRANSDIKEFAEEEDFYSSLLYDGESDDS